jgi:uncharacterized membrane protein
MITRDYLEGLLREGAQWLRLGIEMTGAIIVGIGAFLALSLYLRSVLSRKQANFNAIRLVLARYLALALEFQLGSDILSTAVSPPQGKVAAQWEPIAQLAAIAVIRTGLNYFLGKEIKEEQAAQEETGKQIEQRAAGEGEPPTSPSATIASETSR